VAITREQHDTNTIPQQKFSSGGGTVGSGVFCVIHAKAIERVPAGNVIQLEAGIGG
jgi:hypothetical protein